MSEDEKAAWLAEQKAIEKARLDKEMFNYKFGEDKAKGRDALDDDLLAWKAQAGQSSGEAAAAAANPDQDETMAEAAE
jgi:hypothetical protein